MRRRAWLSWAYLLFLAVLVLPGIGYFLAYTLPLSASQLLEIAVYALLVWLFWVLNVRIFLGGIDTMMESGAWFLFTLLLLRGPNVAFISYFLGTSVYSLFFMRRPEEARAATIIVAALPYGLSFLLAWHLFPHARLKPWQVWEEMLFIFCVQTILQYLAGALYLSLAWDKKFREAWIALTPGNTFLVAGIGGMAFLGLAYISMVFWEAGFYAGAVLLFIPFLLLRRAMQGALKALDEIVNTIDAMVIVIEAKDPYTHYHCNRVALYAEVIARFCGLPAALVEKIGRAARLHDIGKIMVADKVLKKEGGLTDEEYAQIKLHADPNKILMNKIPDGIPLKELIDLGRHHHERFDGKGYPDGLKGEEIPVEVRVISMADAWDAMTSNRSYRSALPDEKALHEVDKFSGKQWDPLVVEAFGEAHAQGALKQVLDSPEILKDPRTAWNIKPKPLRYTPASPKSAPTWKFSPLRFLGSNRRPLFFALGFILLFAFLYWAPASPLRGGGIALYAALAVLLEIWEMKFPKFPVFSPANAVYLASLFVVPWQGVLGLILFGTLAKALYDQSLKPQTIFALLYRPLFFGLSVPFFFWMGLGDTHRLFIQSWLLQSPAGSVYLLAVFCLWAAAFSILKFLAKRIKTLIRRRSWKLSWHLPALKHEIFFQLGFTAPSGLVLAAFLNAGPPEVPYLVGSLALVLTLTYPLLDYYRKIVLSNAETLEALAGAADERFPFYAGHSRRVAELSRKIALELGLADEEIESLELAGQIFGLGNVGIPDDILDKPGPLTEDETRVMRQHAEISGQIAARYSFFKSEVPLVWSHHERADGSGYPSHLQGETVPLGSRILAVADAHCAMISGRPHRPAVPREEAAAAIQKGAGTQFDAKVVDAFLKCRRKGKP